MRHAVSIIGRCQGRGMGFGLKQAADVRLLSLPNLTLHVESACRMHIWCVSKLACVFQQQAYDDIANLLTMNLIASKEDAPQRVDRIPASTSIRMDPRSPCCSMLVLPRVCQGTSNPAYRLLKLGDRRYVLWKTLCRGASGPDEGPESVLVE